MIVVVPYVDGRAIENHLGGICPETLAALNADGIEPLKVALSPDDPTAYWRAVRALWAIGETFAIVEQDIVPFPGAMAELEACEHRWCAFPYALQTGYHAALGCVKFEASLMAEFPHALERVGEIGKPTDGAPPGGPDDDGVAKRDWRRLDTRVARVLAQECGVEMHRHERPVGHLNPAQQIRRSG